MVQRLPGAATSWQLGDAAVVEIGRVFGGATYRWVCPEFDGSPTPEQTELMLGFALDMLPVAIGRLCDNRPLMRYQSPMFEPCGQCLVPDNDFVRMQALVRLQRLRAMLLLWSQTSKQRRAQ